MTELRPETLTTYGNGWARPTPMEIREVVRRSGMSRNEVGRFLGLPRGGKAVSAWIGGERGISYAHWRLLLLHCGEVELIG